MDHRARICFPVSGGVGAHQGIVHSVNVLPLQNKYVDWWVLAMHELFKDSRSTEVIIKDFEPACTSWAVLINTAHVTRQIFHCRMMVRKSWLGLVLLAI
jgi:hypothetical protein